MTDDREREGWTYRVVDDEVEFCGPDPDLDVLTVPLSVVIAALTASGTHWPAPWDQNAAMIDAAAGAEPPAAPGADTTTVDWIKAEWVAQRDAYLAEQREDAP